MLIHNELIVMFVVCLFPVSEILAATFDLVKILVAIERIGMPDHRAGSVSHTFRVEHGSLIAFAVNFCVTR